MYILEFYVTIYVAMKTLVRFVPESIPCALLWCSPSILDLVHLTCLSTSDAETDLKSTVEQLFHMTNDEGGWKLSLSRYPAYCQVIAAAREHFNRW